MGPILPHSAEKCRDRRLKNRPPVGNRIGFITCPCCGGAASTLLRVSLKWPSALQLAGHGPRVLCILLFWSRRVSLLRGVLNVSSLILAGYGHATRVSAFACHLLKLSGAERPVILYIVSSAPQHVFAQSIASGARYRHAEIDPVIVQPLACGILLSRRYPICLTTC